MSVPPDQMAAIIQAAVEAAMRETMQQLAAEGYGPPSSIAAPPSSRPAPVHTPLVPILNSFNTATNTSGNVSGSALNQGIRPHSALAAQDGPFSMSAYDRWGGMFPANGSNMGFKAKGKGAQQQQKEGPKGKMVNMGKKRAALYGLCMDRGYIQYPSIYENMRGMAVQSLACEKYESSDKPVHVSKSFFKWAQLHPTGHYLTETCESNAAPGAELKSMYLESAYAWIVTKSSQPNEDFVRQFYAALQVLQDEGNEGKGGKGYVPSSDAAQTEDEDQAECEHCGTVTTNTLLKRHVGACTGRRLLGTRFPLESEPGSPSPAPRRPITPRPTPRAPPTPPYVYPNYTEEQLQEMRARAKTPPFATRTEDGLFMFDLDAIWPASNSTAPPVEGFWISLARRNIPTMPPPSPIDPDTYHDAQSSILSASPEPAPVAPVATRKSTQTREMSTAVQPVAAIPQGKGKQRARAATPADTGATKRMRRAVTSPVADPTPKSRSGPVSSRGRPTRPYIRE
ncbi:hypothetical protein P7C73_g2069, partial [Tremellales sp. Uapishka_1]